MQMFCCVYTHVGSIEGPGGGDEKYNKKEEEGTKNKRGRMHRRRIGTTTLSVFRAVSLLGEGRARAVEVDTAIQSIHIHTGGGGGGVDQIIFFSSSSLLNRPERDAEPCVSRA